METRGLMFLDYNGTFDDVSGARSRVFIDALREYIHFYNGNVDICVITSAQHSALECDSITGDLSQSLAELPLEVRKHFTFLIEDKCQFISAIDHRDGVSYRLLNKSPLKRGTKKDGVELLLRMLDPTGEISTCVFSGNMITDARMLEAEVGDRKKIFIYAKKGFLKDYDPTVPRYKLSLDPQNANLDFGKDISEKVGASKKIFVRSSANCYGVGRGLHAVVSYLSHQKSTAKTKA